jgi:glycosyltransferase involved in cell wall biosynthesis
MSVIEASACEKPVIVLDVGGLAESVKNGVSGFVVLPGDPEKIEKIIKLVLFDKDLQINIGKD